VFGDYPLWIADLDRNPPLLPIGWTTWSLWQHSQTGLINGIDGDVDLDVLNHPTNAFY